MDLMLMQICSALTHYYGGVLENCSSLIHSYGVQIQSFEPTSVWSDQKSFDKVMVFWLTMDQFVVWIVPPYLAMIHNGKKNVYKHLMVTHLTLYI